MAVNDIDKAVQNLITMDGKKVEVEKVWENASPTSGFKTQNISLDLSDANFIIVEAMYSTTVTNVHVSTLVSKGYDSNSLCILGSAYNGSVTYVSRQVKFTDSEVQFAQGYRKIITSTSVGTGDNAVVIPLKIHAMKGVT